MARTHARIAAALLAAAAAWLAGGAQAAGAAEPAVLAQAAPAQAGGGTGRLGVAVVAVIDLQQLQQQSTASQSITEQLDAQRARFQQEFAQREEQLRATEDELKRQRPTLAEQEFDKRRRALEQQVAEVQRNAQDRRRALDAAFGDAMGQLRETMLKVVREVAVEKGATLVLPRQVILYQADESLDITDAVLQRMNASLPRVTVKLPK